MVTPGFFENTRGEDGGSAEARSAFFARRDEEPPLDRRAARIMEWTEDSRRSSLRCSVSDGRAERWDVERCENVEGPRESLRGSAARPLGFDGGCSRGAAGSVCGVVDCFSRTRRFAFSESSRSMMAARDVGDLYVGESGMDVDARCV